MGSVYVVCCFRLNVQLSIKYKVAFLSSDEKCRSNEHFFVSLWETDQTELGHNFSMYFKQQQKKKLWKQLSLEKKNDIPTNTLIYMFLLDGVEFDWFRKKKNLIELNRFFCFSSANYNSSSFWFETRDSTTYYSLALAAYG